MQNVFYIEELEQATVLLHPARLELLKRLDQPRTCLELAETLGGSAQKIYYHVKALEKAGLVEKVEERRVRGVVEGYYQAKAYSYWLAPSLLGKVGGRRVAQDQASLRVLLGLTEEIQEEVARLAHRSEAGQEVPSLSLSAFINFADPNRRAAFLNEVQTVFQKLAAKYGSQQEEQAAPGQEFRLVLACYPKK